MSIAKGYTLLLFFKRNPQLNPVEFRAYYEANYAPLVMEIAKEARGLIAYTRRYLNHEESDPALGNPSTTFGKTTTTIPYDMVNEVTFESKAIAAEFSRIMYEVKENREKVLADESKLFDKSQMRGIIVEAIVS